MKLRIGMAVLVVAFGVAACGDAAASRTPPPPPVAQTPEYPLNPNAVSALKADHANFAFGDVPIGGGVVHTDFLVRNTSDQPAHLVAAYTSCMCTTADLIMPDSTDLGPFGMPGHGASRPLDRTIQPGGTFTLRATFDPAAHGPDAVGPVQRQVAIHTADGATFTVEFTANVVKGAG